MEELKNAIKVERNKIEENVIQFYVFRSGCVFI